MFEFIILLLSIAANIFVGLLVFLKNPASITSRIFAFLAIGLSGWSFVSYLSIHLESNQLFLVRLTMFFVIFMNTAFFFLVQVFPNATHKISRPLKIFGLFCLLALFVSLSPFLFTGLSKSLDGSISPQPGPGMLVFLIHVGVCVIGGPIYLAKRFRSSKGMERAQLRYFLIGTAIMFSLLPITNFVLPLLFNYSGLILLSPLYTAAFVSLIAYAIVRHHLFDIRFFVVRAVAYFLTFFVVSVIYTVPAIILIIFMLDKSIDNSVILLLAISTLITAVLYQPVRTFFNRATNKFFFRDYYEPQEVLDKLSSLLVASVDLHEIRDKSSSILREALKPELLSYILIADKDPEQKNLLSMLLKKDTEIIDTEELSLKHRDPLYNDLEKRDISLAVRLRTRDDHLGFMVVGYKQSGAAYGSGDKKLLGIAADEIAISLQNALRFEEISQFNVTLQQKIDDATKQLRQANIKLKEIDEAKDEFVSMASHQLRTPLTVIKGYLSMLLEGDMGKVTKQQKEIVKTAFDGAERMVFLIGDLLNVSRLQTGKFQIENQSCDLSAVIGHEVDHLQESATNHQLKLVFDKPKDFPKLMLDETKIRQVIMNFIDNAIYYTPAGGNITVSLEETGQSMSFKVIDTGLGVPKAEQHHLFSKFYRAGNARKMRPDGTGLGLYMAKKIIAAQGGAIIFKSEEGRGSTFGFSLPKHAVEQ